MECICICIADSERNSAISFGRQRMSWRAALEVSLFTLHRMIHAVVVQLRHLRHFATILLVCASLRPTKCNLRQVRQSGLNRRTFMACICSWSGNQPQARRSACLSLVRQFPAHSSGVEQRETAFQHGSDNEQT